MEQVSFSWIAFNFLRVAKPLQGDSLLLISNSPRVLNRTSAVSFSRIALVNHSASVYLSVYTSASLKHATLAKQAYTPPSKVAIVFVGGKEGGGVVCRSNCFHRLKVEILSKNWRLCLFRPIIIRQARKLGQNQNRVPFSKPLQLSYN